MALALCSSPGESEMRKGVERRLWCFAAVLQDAPELDASRTTILQLKVRLASKVGRPELR